VVPDLCADEEVGPLDVGVLLEEIADSLTNLVLVGRTRRSPDGDSQSSTHGGQPCKSRP